MNVVANMVDTETVVARTAGTVTEFQPGIIGISSSADGTFVMIELTALFLSDFSGFPAEIDRGTVGSARNKLHQRSGKEDKEIQYCNDRQKVDRKRVGQNGNQKICSIDQGHVFHLYGDEIKEQNPLIRKQGCIGKEHGKVQILCINPDPIPPDKVYQKAVEHG